MSFPSVRSIVASLLISASVVACGGGSSSAPATARETKPVATPDPSCPVTVAGTSVNVEDTDAGAALVFITTGDVAEVRKRVRTLAQMHNDHHESMGPLPDGTGGGGGHEGHDMSKMGSGATGHEGHDMSKMGEHAGHAGGMISVHSKATAADVPGGAKVVFMANGGDVGKLQTELRMHAQHFASGSCEMGNH